MKRITILVGSALIALAACSSPGKSTPRNDKAAPPARVASEPLGELLPGSLQFLHGRNGGAEDELWFTYNVGRVGDDAVEAAMFRLDGPGVHEVFKPEEDARHHDWITWDTTWPAGQYVVTIEQCRRDRPAPGSTFGVMMCGELGDPGMEQPYARQQFEVRRVPAYDGPGTPLVPQTEVSPMILEGDRWHTTFAIDVTHPVVSVDAVWVKDGGALGDRADPIVRADSLARRATLGSFHEARGRVPASIDPHGAMLVLFLDGTRLVGAWSYADGGNRAIELRPATPDARQLAAARAVAAERGAAARADVREPDVPEQLACAAAASHEVWDALAVSRVPSGLPAYRKGCLLALGVPMLPDPSSEGLRR